MDQSDLLIEAYGRIAPLVAQAVDGLDAEALAARPAEGANTVGWLVWHLARVQDHHLAEVLDEDQLWVSGDWAAPLRAGARSRQHRATGTRPTRWRPSAPTAPTPAPATWRRWRPGPTAFLGGLGSDDLDRVVDERWDPPVTLGVRLVSVVDDSLQHAGQAAYARGLLD